MNNQRRKEIQAVLDELAALRSRVEDLQNGEQDYFDNMPENLQQSERGEKAEQAASRLEDALTAFDEIEEALNEAAEWLRGLIKGGHIAPGVVDERSIEDVKPSDLSGFTQCHFFAGIGVWSYALRRAGWRDDSPIWTGSCPCQPFSAAGKGNGFADERHLWPAWFHLITQCEPAKILGEQVASSDGLAWLDLVQTDLEATGYAVGAFDLCAAGVGAPHIRQRLYFVADASGEGLQGRGGPERSFVEPNRQAIALRNARGLPDPAYGAELGSEPRAIVGGAIAKQWRRRRPIYSSRPD